MSRSQLAIGCVVALGHAVFLVGTMSGALAQEKAGAREVRRIDSGEQGIIRCAISPSGRLALTAGNDGTVRMFHLESGKELKKFKEHNGQSYTVAFSPVGWLALSGGEDGRLVLWDLDVGEKVRALDGHGANVCGAAFSPDGKLIASGSWDRSIRVWDVATGKELRKLEGHSDGIMAVAFSPDSKTLASAGGEDKTVRLWDVGSGKELKKLEGHAAMVRAVAFSPSGTHVLSGGYQGDNTARLWDVLTGKEVLTLKCTDGVHGLAISSDGRHALIAVPPAKEAQCWDLQTGKLLHTFGGIHATDAVFLPDGEHAVIADGEKSLRLVRLPK